MATNNQTTVDQTQPKEKLDIWQIMIIVIGAFTLVAIVIAIIGIFFPSNSSTSSSFYTNEANVVCNVVINSIIQSYTVTMNVKRNGNQCFISWPLFSGTITTTASDVTLTSSTGTNPLPSWAVPVDTGVADQDQIYAGTVIESSLTPVYYGPSYLTVNALSTVGIIYYGWNGAAGGGTFPVGGYTVYPGSATYPGAAI